MKKLIAMGGKFFLLGILFFAFLELSGQIDGVYLRMRLHPVQILSVGGGSEAGRASAETTDRKYITVSSTTGFEVSIYHKVDASGNRNIINSNKGAVHKDFAIDYNINSLNREIYTDTSLKSADLVLTLISQ